VQPPELSEEEVASLTNVRDEQLITSFVDANLDPSEAAIQDFIERLRERDIVLSERRIRKLVRDEVNRRNNVSPAYDLEFDVLLREAVKRIRTGELPMDDADTGSAGAQSTRTQAMGN